MSAGQVYEGWLAWAKEFDKPLYEKLFKNQKYFVKVCNIDREGPKPRKDIYCYGMIAEYFDYMVSPVEAKELDEVDSEKFDEFIKAYSQDFTLAPTKEEWFAGVKNVAEKLGYATDNKLYKQNPGAYKGNTAKACEMLRLALTRSL